MAQMCNRGLEAHGHQAGARKTILFVPIDSYGHINSLIGIANCLNSRGHRTVFLHHSAVASMLSKGRHEVYDCSSEGLVESEPAKAETGGSFYGLIRQMNEVLQNPTSEKTIGWIRMAWKTLRQMVLDKDAIFSRKLELIKPDFIICDQYYVQPAILKFGKPWALVFSASPLGLHPKEHNLPPPFMGIPSNYLQMEDGQDKQKYLDLAEVYSEAMADTFTDWIRYLEREHGISLSGSFVQMSPFLNVYFYPKELDYEIELEGWQQCDSILRNNSIEDEREQEKKAPFEIPAQLADKPGKLIYVSMGTVACANLDLMRRVVEILSKSPNRFIVSKGPFADEYELAPNMWGGRYLEQLAILPLVDLIITHGGNNTITECFYYGVPRLIVCPVFADQKDNAQRIEECKLGKRVDLFHCNEGEFLKTIEEVLRDDSIKPRMRAISQRMQLPENRFKAVRLFTKFVEGQAD